MSTNRTSQIEAELQALLLESLHIEVENRDTDLLEGGLLDSLTLVELLFQAEQHFGIQLSLDELDFEDLRTVARLGRVIAERER